MKLSVIVCTRNRAYAITECLDSIAAALANASPLDAEIVVVDNGSTDDTPAIIKGWVASCAFPVRSIAEPIAGLSLARNRALRAAQGDLLVFTDDDCRLSKDYVNDLLRHDAADTGLVLRGGRVELGDPTDLPLTIKTSRTQVRWHRKTNAARHDNIANSIVGCNMAMRREVAEYIGPFDERFGPGTSIPAAEDTDWTFRAYLANIAIEYVPDMVIFHHHGRKLPSDGNKLLRNYGIGNGAVYVKFLFKDPNLCRQFYWDVKTSIKEIGSGKSNFFPQFGFSRHRWLRYCVLGAMRYVFVVLRRPLAGNGRGR
jgi:glycosyltransferase involved in cell wall biosynthesis